MQRQDEMPGNFFRGLFWALVLTGFLGLIFVAGLCVGRAWGEQAAKTWEIHLAWDYDDPPADLAGFRLYQNGAKVLDIPEEARDTILNLPAGTYEWYLTAYDDSLNESVPSNTAAITLDEVPPATSPVNVRISISVNIGQE